MIATASFSDATKGRPMYSRLPALSTAVACGKCVRPSKLMIITASQLRSNSSIEPTSFTSILTMSAFHFGKLSTLSGMSALAGAAQAVTTRSPANSGAALGSLKSCVKAIA